MKIALRIAVAAAIMMVLAQGARFTLGERHTEGMLRLSWRTLGERVRICREYTAEERSTLRQHMQQVQSCSVSLLPYKLEVQVDDAISVTRRIVPAGTRSDRPLYVNEDFQLSPGEHRLRLSFAPEDEPLSDSEAGSKNAESEAGRKALRKALDNARHYTMDQTVRITAGRIILVDLDPDRAAFRIFGESLPK